MCPYAGRKRTLLSTFELSSQASQQDGGLPECSSSRKIRLLHSCEFSVWSRGHLKLTFEFLMS